MPPWIPKEAIQITLVIFLSFLIGLEREEQRVRTQSYHFGGVRTYPLLGLIGLLLTKLFGQAPMAIGLGLIAIVPFLAISYYFKLTREQGGFTSEMTGIIAYLSGALVGQELYWMAIAVVIFNVLLLQAKEGLERLGHKIPSYEIGTFLIFLLLTTVLLPIVPNQEFTRFAINPFKTWLVVVAVCGISYGSYILQWFFRSRDSIILAGLLGGAYSSTVTTVVLAKKARQDQANRIYPYAISIATSLMYARVAILVWFFSEALFAKVGWYFLGLASTGVGLSYLGAQWAGATSRAATEQVNVLRSRNPLDISTAFIFAALFVVVMVLTRLAAENFGSIGTWVIALLMGLVDVDAFILGLAQGSAGVAPIQVAVVAIALVTASNNASKIVYAYIFGDRRTGLVSMLLLGLLTLASLPVLFWIYP